MEKEVEKIILADRVTTGTKELDSLLFGGIPQGYTVALTGSPSEERDFLIKRYLEAGLKKGQVTFDITSEAVGLENLVEDFQNIFFLFLYNSRPKTQVPASPNVYELQGTNLTNLSIALIKAFQKLDQSFNGPKRACIEILSDILLRHKAEETRRWLSETFSNFNSRGFTMLFVVNPLMHLPDQLQAILDLFDGEINLYEDESEKGPEKFLRIKKLRKKEYNKNSIPLK